MNVLIAEIFLEISLPYSLEELVVRLEELVVWFFEESFSSEPSCPCNEQKSLL